MLKRMIVGTGLIVVFATFPVLAQTPHIEISGWAGWAFSDGVSGGSIAAGDGNIYNRVDPKDSAIFGFSAGVLTRGNGEVGFMYSRQSTQLVLGGTAERELGDMAVSTYHGYFGYNGGASDSKIRPYGLIGFGATSFSDVSAVVLGVPRNIPGRTNFSTTLAAGVKYFVTPSVGIRAQARWTPTYIKTDSAGWWCDPYWGCYVAGNPQYSNQVELAGGITIRF